ncbi:hypothetical protein Ahy_A08g041309 [Arachis hypogaea]|uniref:K+ potassium transporter integral membrane domain-containing protein n=1 Tax=Arachis hypogaea TaxID=3818 RepID=A0A445C2C5_ARAHY|nr:hypothetical protein Ahy_A08g041309 [Arachis hypogaea]
MALVSFATRTLTLCHKRHPLRLSVSHPMEGRAYSHLTVTHATSFPIVFSIRRQAHRLLHLVHGTVKRIVFSIVFLVAAATQQPTSSPSSASPSASSSAFPFQQQASSSVSRSLSSSQLPPGSSVVFSDHSVSYWRYADNKMTDFIDNGSYMEEEQMASYYLLIEAVYFSSQITKFMEGSYIPILSFLFLMMIMEIWHYMHKERYMFDLNLHLPFDGDQTEEIQRVLLELQTEVVAEKLRRKVLEDEVTSEKIKRQAIDI